MREIEREARRDSLVMLADDFANKYLGNCPTQLGMNCTAEEQLKMCNSHISCVNCRKEALTLFGFEAAPTDVIKHKVEIVFNGKHTTAIVKTGIERKVGIAAKHVDDHYSSAIGAVISIMKAYGVTVSELAESLTTRELLDELAKRVK